MNIYTLVLTLSFLSIVLSSRPPQQKEGWRRSPFRFDATHYEIDDDGGNLPDFEEDDDDDDEDEEYNEPLSNHLTANMHPLIANARPTVVDTSNDTTRREGDFVILTCKFRGGDDLQIDWYFNDHLLNRTLWVEKRTRQMFTLATTMVECTTQLYLRSLAFNNTGSYVCEARNRKGRTRETINLIVLRKQSINIIGQNPRDSTFVVPHELVLHCRVRSDYEPHISWMANTTTSLKYPQSSTIKQGTDSYESTLVLHNLTTSDSGVYTCLALNPQTKEIEWKEAKVTIMPQETLKVVSKLSYISTHPTTHKPPMSHPSMKENSWLNSPFTIIYVVIIVSALVMIMYSSFSWKKSKSAPHTPAIQTSSVPANVSKNKSNSTIEVVFKNNDHLNVPYESPSTNPIFRWREVEHPSVHHLNSLTFARSLNHNPQTSTITEYSQPFHHNTISHHRPYSTLNRYHQHRNLQNHLNCHSLQKKTLNSYHDNIRV